MNRADLQELHCIMPIENMPSVMNRGILSHVRSAHVPHESVANEEVQLRRARVRVPGGRRLHEYANLYLHARNPMMYVRKEAHSDLCVISVSTDVLDLPGVVVTERNASVDFVRFEAAPEGLSIVNRALTFATYWTDPDPIEQTRQKQAKQAEVLVPGEVDPAYIKGAYVSGPDSGARLTALVPTCRWRQQPYLFFR